ncbi:transcription-repair coupling factor [Pedomonas sp. V897]|uniref:transcription-repair coupling factor n=1 Tax=Pedomonas sp. V897 TaxID=3446482 RepID=UPI003EE41836
MIAPKQILESPTGLTLAGCVEGFVPWLLADLARAAGQSGRAVYIARDDAAASQVADAAPYFAPELEVVYLPAWDCLPYDRASPATRVVAERLAALARLAGKRSDKPQLLVTTVNAAIQRTLQPHRIRKLVRRIAVGDALDRESLTALLMAAGYVRADTVVEPGEFAVRGGLVDVFPAGQELPVRLDFFGDEIDSIRRFEPADQRTVERIERFTLMPVNEVLLDEDSVRRFRQRYVEAFGAVLGHDPLYAAVSEQRRLAGMEHWLPLFEEELATLFDYLGERDAILLDAHAEAAARTRFEAINDYYDARRSALLADKGSYHPLPPDQLYLTPDGWRAALEAARAHATTPFEQPPSETILSLATAPAHDFAPERANQPGNVFNAVGAHLAELRRSGRKVILASYTEGSRERLEGLLADHGVKPLIFADSWQEALGVGAKGVALIVLGLDHGFTTADVAVLTEQDILGDRLVRKRRRIRKADNFLTEVTALNTGDLVVHSEHGIGRYEGLATIEVGDAPHDCVQLTYADGDKLYVPVENIDVLTRYGSDSEGVALDKLGGAAWQARKARFKERIREIAGELLKVAAERALRQADVIETDSGAYAEFCARFPYAETEDQLKAVNDVLEDLASGKPMDRLVCGDVGFGKTEVALRAAFAAAMAGHQVAVIAPTTLLARQHAATFEARFAGFPLRIGKLFRLVSQREQTATKQGLADGTVDIVIGTHALLGKGISFKRLGLVIVDEEQHFGVTHKERLKQLRADVHVLTLTATPIPRTLQMAMTGLRELSLIATPPVDRLAVRTYVAPWDDVVIREALLREHYRGGQSFIVVPRISDLAEIETFLREAVPEVKFITAHGQMAASDIEERMTAFYDRQYDVLLSTTIVESGLDIPSANTLILYRADMFGLAQLYQLRGRVGRSKVRAYAYLTTDPKTPLTPTAEKRLQVLSSLEGLGAGFQLASHDLDIRGAGNLLGDEQSGHIREIGFELYQQMLEEAITAAQARAAGVKESEIEQEEFSPQINVGASILIPEDYVPDLTVRMGLYRRIGELSTRAEIDSFAAEMIDRFGKMPREFRNLLHVVEIKALCRIAGIAKLDAGPRGATVTFRNDQFANPAGLVAYLTKLKGTAKLRPDHKLVVVRAWTDEATRLSGALSLAKGLAKVARQAEAA